MPVFNDQTMETHKISGSNFGFSATRVEDLGASEYTLVVIAADKSSSVSPFSDDIEEAVKQVVKSCRRSPRSDNLMLRLVTFNGHVEEFHGFKPLTECDENDYNGCVPAQGMTALYDAAFTSVESAIQYGKDLSEQDFDTNVIVFVVTDGDDNSSTMTRKSIKDAVESAVIGEQVESIVSVLVGVNVQNPTLSNYLQSLKDEAGFTQYVEIADATEKNLAKLAEFVSQSISSQSQALGTGGPSKSLSF